MTLDHVPEDNAVALRVALEQAMLEETVLAGPEHTGRRKAFTAWLRQSWTKYYGVFAVGNGALRVELDRMENAGEAEAMVRLP